MRLVLGSSRERLILAALILGLVLCSSTSRADEATSEPGAGTSDPAAIEFFEKSVRPILVERCQGCHGAAKQKGGLRLDSRQAAIAGGTTSPAVVPGQPEKSLLVEAINYGEPYQMPPKSKLPAGEIDTLTRWVKQGAVWGPEPRPASPIAGLVPGPSRSRSGPGFARGVPPEGQPLVVPANPQDRAAGVGERGARWASNPIDRFLFSAMERHGLTPAPEADKRTLIRRLTYDLTGLPPTPAEVAAFLADTGPDAYERVVDRLLASPHHGERWARHWLDLARFAETAGHEFDYETLNAHRYRDYVIRALNADLPYDRFVIEQVAGDLLETPRRHPAARVQRVGDRDRLLLPRRRNALAGGRPRG